MEITEKQVKEFRKQKIEKFLKELSSLVEKHRVQVVAVPYLDQDGRIKAEVSIHVLD